MKMANKILHDKMSKNEKMLSRYLAKNFQKLKKMCLKMSENTI